MTKAERQRRRRRAAMPHDYRARLAAGFLIRHMDRGDTVAADAVWDELRSDPDGGTLADLVAGWVWQVEQERVRTGLCSRPMITYETAQSGAVLDDPVCGRRVEHPGPCRSPGAVVRYYGRGSGRDAEARDAARRERYRLLRNSGIPSHEATRLKDVRPERWPVAESSLRRAS